MYFVSLAPQGLVAGSVELHLLELLEGNCHDQMTSFSFFGVSGHIFFQAIFKASDTQHNKASDTQHNLNEHTLKGGGKSTDTHRSKIKGLKLSAAKKCTKETFISDNLQGFPGATL